VPCTHKRWADSEILAPAFVDFVSMHRTAGFYYISVMLNALKIRRPTPQQTPLTRYYRELGPRPRGTTVKLVPIPVVLPWPLSPLPWSNRGYCGKTMIPIPTQVFIGNASARMDAQRHTHKCSDKQTTRRHNASGSSCKTGRGIKSNHSTYTLAHTTLLTHIRMQNMYAMHLPTA